MNEKRGLNIILISSIIAIFVSLYLTYIHYSDTSSFCDISQGLSCDIVNRSLYSEIFGIPVSFMSLVVFYFIALITMSALRNKKIFGLYKKDIINLIFWLMVISILLALYLIYIELFVLYSICVLCVLLDIMILIIFIMAMKLRGEK